MADRQPHRSDEPTVADVATPTRSSIADVFDDAFEVHPSDLADGEGGTRGIDGNGMGTRRLAPEPPAPRRSGSITTERPFDEREASKQIGSRLSSDSSDLRHNGWMNRLSMDDHVPKGSSEESAPTPRARQLLLAHGNAPATFNPSTINTSQHNDRREQLSSSRMSNDNAAVPFRTPSMISTSTTNTARRSFQSSSTFSMPPRAQSPYQGPSGAQHPYGMYEQGTNLTRTPSNATSSTIRAPARSYSGPRGPTHPYALYPQNTTEHIEPDPVLSLGIPVGFPGHRQVYHRRLGPDGEEAADIIGPDGHTEQLPPYTRYPENAQKGVAGFGAVVEPSSVNESTVVPSRLSTRSSMTESVRSPLEVEEPNHQPLPSEESIGTKEKWTEKGKRRICRGKVPIWVIILMIGVLCLGILLGIMLGALHARHEAREAAATASSAAAASSSSQSLTATVTVTTSYDAAPLTSAPTNLPSPTAGKYSVKYNIIEDQSSGCLPGQQTPSWSCSVSNFSYLQILPPPSGQTYLPYSAKLTAPNGTSTLYYGAQPPYISQPQVLSMVLDVDDQNKGPALYFEAPYDKVVIVPDEMLSHTSKRDESDMEKRHPHWGTIVASNIPASPAQPGSRPWVCHWNATIIEGFIYLNSTAAGNGMWGTATASLSAAASSAASSSVPSGHKAKRDGDTTSGTCPNTVKIEERRKPNPGPDDPSPYCEQFEVLDDGSLGSLGNRIQLQASLPTYPKMQKRQGMDCHCEWVMYS